MKSRKQKAESRNEKQKEKAESRKGLLPDFCFLLSDF